MNTYYLLGILFVSVFIVFTFMFMRGLAKQREAEEKAFKKKVYKYQLPFDAKLIELGVKEKWDHNREHFGFKNINVTTTSFGGFISSSFDWNKTSEGSEFWKNISNE